MSEVNSLQNTQSIPPKGFWQRVKEVFFPTPNPCIAYVAFEFATKENGDTLWHSAEAFFECPQQPGQIKIKISCMKDGVLYFEPAGTVSIIPASAFDADGQIKSI